MCLSCGCGEAFEGHDDDDHIKAQDIAKAAKANDQSFDKTVENISTGASRMSEEDKQKAMEMAQGDTEGGEEAKTDSTTSGM